MLLSAPCKYLCNSPYFKCFFFEQLAEKFNLEGNIELQVHMCNTNLENEFYSDFLVKEAAWMSHAGYMNLLLLFNRLMLGLPLQVTCPLWISKLHLAVINCFCTGGL